MSGERLNAALEDRYRIERKLGEGGMATVYLSEDLKHDRKVALKVLKPELAAVVGADRFLAEIRTTANLQHPHILPLFDSGEADGFLYYVMPYVEGDSLRERLDREKQLPIDEAVRIATEVADALAHAHSKGVIHRDIKPANILLPDGRVQVADFGIALAVSAAGGSRLTETGLSVGTPHYMSPEQATGDRELDGRSDVYSLGCVLYEMLAGEPPHTGPTAQSILSKILTEEPRPLTELRKAVQPNLDAAVRKALEKFPADRFASAQELARALEDSAFRHGNAGTSDSSGSSRSWKRLSVGFGGLAALLGALALWGWLREAPYLETPDVPLRASITDIQARAALNTGVRMAISRDGSHIAVASFVDGVSRLFLRRSDQSEFEEIEGAEGAQGPSFSPDGEWLAFMQRPLGALAPAQIMRVRVSGGPVRPVTEGGRPHWGLDDTIVFEREDAIYRVSPTGGDAVLIVAGMRGNAWPHLLPDGRAVLFTRDEDYGMSILIADLESGTITDLDLRGANPRYVPTGHIVFGHVSQVLMAVPFDLDTHRLTGEPSTVLPGVLVYEGGATQFAVSETGTALYGLPGPSGVGAGEMVVVDPKGVATPTPLGEGGYKAPRFSPDGRLIAYQRDNRIWIYDQVLGGDSLLTTDGRGFFPATWSPDGSYVYFGSNRENTLGVDAFRKVVYGSGEAQHLASRRDDQYPLSTSRDGQRVLVGERTEARGWDLLIATEGEEGTTYTDYLRAPWNELMGTISPTEERVAYVSNESGVPEVYLRSFPDGVGKLQVSEGGGIEPRWAPDGAAVYYLAGGRLMKAPVAGDGIGEPQPLFEGSWVSAASGGSPVMTNWDVHPTDGSFVFVRNPRLSDGADPPVVPIEVMVNWFEELKRLVPNR